MNCGLYLYSRFWSGFSLIRFKRRDHIKILTGVFLHQDNALGHITISTQLGINLLEFEVLEHPPDSPDFASMFFQVFSELKAFLRVIILDSTSALTKYTNIDVSLFSEEKCGETATFSGPT